MAVATHEQPRTLRELRVRATELGVRDQIANVERKHELLLREPARDLEQALAAYRSWVADAWEAFATAYVRRLKAEHESGANVMVAISREERRPLVEVAVLDERRALQHYQETVADARVELDAAWKLWGEDQDAVEGETLRDVEALITRHEGLRGGER